MRSLLTLVLIFLTLPASVLWAQDTRVPQSRMDMQLSFAPLVREAAPAVVNIYARRVTEARASPFADDPFFRDFFRQAPGRSRVTNSLGSGVILSPDGFVVSNYHVVGQATEIRVVLNDRREFDARLVLSDEESDLAILKIEADGDLPSLSLRDSESIEVGELVLAIGNPFGVGQTVSSGIVSGLARSGTATGNARGYFIQTDAPINPGNSGGALIDVSGQLIGVNTAILTRSGGSNGIGFAIPSDLVGQFLQQAKQGHSRFQRPWAGVQAQALDGDLAASLGLGVPRGILLSWLHPLSPLTDAGLRTGDLVLAVNGEEVNTPSEMLYRMSVRSLGESVSLRVMREGREFLTNVALILPPDRPEAQETILDRRSVLPGLAVARVNPALARALGLPARAEGTLVLDPGRAGARIGLRRGDLIRSIDNRPLSGPRALARDLEAAGSRVLIEVRRGNRRIALRFAV